MVKTKNQKSKPTRQVKQSHVFLPKTLNFLHCSIIVQCLFANFILFYATCEQSKKRGKENDISEFRAQLDVLGLKIIQVTADGNCFFRFVVIHAR